MKMRRWVSQRGPAFIGKRMGALLSRYGIRSRRAEARIEALMAVFARHGCAPTFPTPGRVVQSHSRFIRRLQDAGAEIAVHSYDHVDLKGYPPEEARDQLLKGARTFERYGIENHGFRCPYLSCTPALLDMLPNGLFGYSSNDAVSWDLLPTENAAQGESDYQGSRGPTSQNGHTGTPPQAANGSDSRIWTTLKKFYDPQPSSSVTAMPRMRNGLVEIPVSVPDDLQLYDGLKVGTDGLAAAWINMLDQIYRRGELFTLIFHPELAERCLKPFDALLAEAGLRKPGVWVAPLRAMRDWWCEKLDFTANLSATPDCWQITFVCTERATILARDLPVESLTDSAEWYGRYRRLGQRALGVPGSTIPFVGLPADAPARVVTFLQEQGYLLKIGDQADRCAIYLDAGTLGRLKTEVALLEHIESSPGPLVRYWRWPDGARSALSITGDLDALTLMDYASRLWVH
jgi:peptidoglycan/xylan/chitin deacetylase (PgdA/CDA1 family)